MKDEVSGREGRTSGLLQLTYEDQKRYGCDFDWERDKTLKANDPERTILQPKNNLEYGVKILEKQIIEKHKALLSEFGVLVDAAAGDGELSCVCEADDECSAGLQGGGWQGTRHR